MDGLPQFERWGDNHGDPVKHISSVSLFFLSTSRNAWNWTRANRYSRGCMHLSSEDAFVSAEKKRVQGTVFIVEEIPAIAVSVNDGALLITMINHKKPFSGFATKSLGNWVQGRLGRCASKPDFLFHAALKFESDSMCWRAREDIDENNLHFLWAGSEASKELKPLPQRKLSAWQSSSHGPDLPLFWGDLTPEISPFPTHRVVKNFMEY